MSHDDVVQRRSLGAGFYSSGSPVFAGKKRFSTENLAHLSM